MCEWSEYISAEIGHRTEGHGSPSGWHERSAGGHGPTVCSAVRSRAGKHGRGGALVVAQQRIECLLSRHGPKAHVSVPSPIDCHHLVRNTTSISKRGWGSVIYLGRSDVIPPPLGVKSGGTFTNATHFSSIKPCNAVRTRVKIKINICN